MDSLKKMRSPHKKRQTGAHFPATCRPSELSKARTLAAQTVAQSDLAADREHRWRSAQLWMTFLSLWKESAGFWNWIEAKAPPRTPSSIVAPKVWTAVDLCFAAFKHFRLAVSFSIRAEVRTARIQESPMWPASL
jgi:hypothetical protein